ncbi:MAG TPA: hypothetical protein VF766_14090 [Pyrinomonadaceae bacterium]
MGVKQETAIGIAASVIAILAIVVSVWQGVEQRRHNRLSVKPALNFDTDSAVDGTILSVALKNAGTGPAIIKQFTLYIDDRPVPAIDGDVWLPAEKILGLEDPNIHFTDYCYYAGDVMPANETQHIINIDRKDYENLADKEKWKKAISRIKLKVVYASIYEEQYETRFPLTHHPDKGHN